MPKSDRPRERLLSHGPANLSDTELLAVMLGSGMRGRGVMALASEILPLIDRKNGKLSAPDLLAIPGLGSAKATLLLAAHEFARRRIRPNGVKINRAQDVLALVSHLAMRSQEHFVSVTLNGAHEVIACRVVTIGLLNASQIHPREVFSDAITDRAAALIVGHNHPSQVLSPSEEDKAVTKRLAEAGKLLGMPVLDHIIFSTIGYFSFNEAGLM